MGGRVVVITGASGGVGRATAREFARAGDDLGLLARGEAGLEGARLDAEAMGVRALPISVDVAEAEAVETAADRIEEELGPIDVWVNNAMTTIFSPAWDIEPDEYRRATEVTYLGGVWGTMAALRRMRPRDRGTIVNVGSALAYRSIPLQSAYCGAKFGLRGFTDSVRCELIHEDSAIHLTMVHLPGLDTTQFSWCRAKLPAEPQPVPPIYAPEVAARSIEWASRNDRREVWAGLPVYKTILGNKVAPGFLDRYLADKAWQGQFTDEPLEGEREGNLFEPVDDDRDHGARGAFGDRARGWSPVSKAARHPGWIAAGVGVLGAAVAWWISGD
ncbi:MAG: SDR family oxidoreductase [Gemmatimonadota bacterium]|nr:SDR family oxidoreductase [Gemmatimonadota bacterium]